MDQRVLIRLRKMHKNSIKRNSRHMRNFYHCQRVDLLRDDADHFAMISRRVPP